MPESRSPFKSVQEAAELIRSYNKSFQIPVRNKSQSHIAKNLISGNIARSFSGLSRRPTDVLDEWGIATVDHLMSDLAAIASQHDFDQVIHRYAHNLINFWDKTFQSPSKRMGWGPASKITNIFVKVLHQSGHIQNGHIFQYMHVPFDEYTLKPLKLIVNDLADVKYGINIPTNPTMKYVDTPLLYDILQGAVRRLCEQSGSYPIVYEYFCWDERH